MRRRWLVPAILLGLGGVRPLAAQQAQAHAPEMIDRVAAIVGDRVVLLSEIDERLQQQRATGVVIPTDSAGYAQARRAALESLIDEEVLYQAAKRDTTINIADNDVQVQVEDQYRQLRGQYHTEREWQQQLQTIGFGTTDEYRRFLTDQIRRNGYIQQYIHKLQDDGKLHAPAPSERTLREAYEEALRDTTQVRRRPPTITFKQIVITPQPTHAADSMAEARAESALVQLKAGADFATLARRLSDDSATRDQGGDLGWFRRGMMVREFEDVAFHLRPGVPSPIVHTSFGYHIIEVERVQPAEIKARHILFMPAIDDSQVTRAQRLADSLVAWVRAGASFDSLQRIYSDTTEPRTMGPLDRTTMVPEFQDAFQGAQPGHVLPPIAVDADNHNRTKFVVALVTDVQPERNFTFDEVRDFIRRKMQDQAAQEQLIASLRRDTYIDIRLP